MPDKITLSELIKLCDKRGFQWYLINDIDFSSNRLMNLNVYDWSGVQKQTAIYYTYVSYYPLTNDSVMKLSQN